MGRTLGLWTPKTELESSTSAVGDSNRCQWLPLVATKVKVGSRLPRLSVFVQIGTKGGGVVILIVEQWAYEFGNITYPWPIPCATIERTPKHRGFVMRLFAPPLIVLVALVFTNTGRSQVPSESIDALVAKLGSQRYAERQAATAALDKQGEAALSALQAAAKRTDPEVRNRATLLVDRIETRIESARLLAGTKLRLVFKDALVLDAVRDFAGKAGVNMEFQGEFDRAGLGQRKLTMDSGETTFWEAFDLFCRQAGLCQRPSPAPPAMPGNPFFQGNNQTSRIAFIDAKSAEVPTAWFGAIRFRAVPPAWVGHDDKAPPAKRPESVGFHLEVTPEPKLAWQSALSLKITHAVDEHGQKLVQPETYLAEPITDPLLGFGGVLIGNAGPTGLLNDPTNSSYLLARLTRGKELSRVLKEVRGTVTVQLSTTQPLLSVDELLTSSGKPLTAKDGTSVKVVRGQQQGRDVTLQVLVGNATPSTILGGWQKVQVFKNKNGVLYVETAPVAPPFSLTDNSGKPLTLVSSQNGFVEDGKGGLETEYTLHYKLADAKASPGPLRYLGPRLVTVDVPFVLQDVPLCDDPHLPVAETIRRFGGGGFGGGGFGGGGIQIFGPVRPLPPLGGGAKGGAIILPKAGG
jgi:hypothetical protein